MRVARRCLVMEKNPVPSCHASTVLRLPGGEGDDDVGIYPYRGDVSLDDERLISRAEGWESVRESD